MDTQVDKATIQDLFAASSDGYTCHFVQNCGIIKTHLPLPVMVVTILMIPSRELSCWYINLKKIRNTCVTVLLLRVWREHQGHNTEDFLFIKHKQLSIFQSNSD